MADTNNLPGTSVDQAPSPSGNCMLDAVDYHDSDKNTGVLAKSGRRFSLVSPLFRSIYKTTSLGKYLELVTLDRDSGLPNYRHI